MLHSSSPTTRCLVVLISSPTPTPTPTPTTPDRKEKYSPVQVLAFRLQSVAPLSRIRLDRHSTFYTTPHQTHHQTTKMKLYYMGVLRHAEGQETAIELAAARELSSFGFFERNSVSQFMSFFSTTVAARTKPGQRQQVEEGTTYIGHCYARSEGLVGVIVSDREYPTRVAFSLLNKIMDEYLAKYPRDKWISAKDGTGLEYPALDDYLKKYQDPQQADTIMRVQQELDETKIVLHKTIEGVLARGEKLDSLVDKSEALSSSSKLFYKQAKKTNSCCTIM